MNRLSTHVLDLSAGKPAENVLVQLHKQQTTENWLYLGEGATNADGRKQFGSIDELGIGVYKLVLQTKNYFQRKNVSTFFPSIEVIFEITSLSSSLHIPVLLSPFGYSTYRGS